MPANRKTIAGMVRSYIGHRLARDHQRPIRCQPCLGILANFVIVDLGGYSRTAFGPHPYQSVAGQRVARKFCGLRHWPAHA